MLGLRSTSRRRAVSARGAPLPRSLGRCGRPSVGRPGWTPAWYQAARRSAWNPQETCRTRLPRASRRPPAVARRARQSDRAARCGGWRISTASARRRSRWSRAVLAPRGWSSPWDGRAAGGWPARTVINFTQEGGVERAVVRVNLSGDASGSANVLTATRIDLSTGINSQAFPEINNQVIIAGPAEVRVAPVAGATLLITYKKEHNEGAEETPPPVVISPTPAATVTPSPTPTPTPTP